MRSIEAIYGDMLHDVHNPCPIEALLEMNRTPFSSQKACSRQQAAIEVSDISLFKDILCAPLAWHLSLRPAAY
jgi:hypothetical protein